MPTVRELSLRCRCSPVTVCRALAVLKRDGTLSAGPRTGIHIAVAAADAGLAHGESISAGPAPVATLKLRIERDIFAGRFQQRAGMLPSLKELSSAYGTSPAPMRRALEAMITEQLVEKRHKRYHVVLRVPGTFSSSIVLFARGGLAGTLELVTERHHELVSAFERVCFARKALLRSVGICVSEQLSPLLITGRKHGANPGRDIPILGYVIVRAGIAQSMQLLSMVARAGKPVVVIDEDDVVRAPQYDVARPNVQVLAVGTSRAHAFSVGRRLLSLGHRNAVYLSPFAGARWSDNRQEGLQSCFGQPGSDAWLTAITTDLRAFWPRFTNTMTSPDLYGILDSEQLAAAIAGAYEGFSRPVNRWAKGSCRGLPGVRSAARALFTMFEQALETHASAWVACNDVVGLLALDFLSRTGVAVPGQVSLMSFDDTFGALRRGLASCSLDLPAVAHGAVSMILAPRATRRAYGNGPVEIPGLLVERASLGPSPGEHTIHGQPASLRVRSNESIPVSTGLVPLP